MFEKMYHDKRKLLNVEPDVDIADLLAAREDLAIIEKTSNVSVRKNTRTQLNKVIIGMVSCNFNIKNRSLIILYYLIQQINM